MFSVGVAVGAGVGLVDHMTPAETIREALPDLRRVAEAADNGNPWEWEHAYPQRITRVGDVVLVADCFEDPDSPSVFAEYIATFDPPTVLALLAALTELEQREATLLRNIQNEAVQTIQAKEYGSEQFARAEAAEADRDRLQAENKRLAEAHHEVTEDWLRKKDERDRYREALERRQEMGHADDCPVTALVAPGGLIFDPTIECDCGYDIARAALAAPDTEWRRQQIDRLVDEGHDEDMAARLVDSMGPPTPLGAAPDTPPEGQA